MSPRIDLPPQCAEPVSNKSTLGVSVPNPEVFTYRVHISMPHCHTLCLLLSFKIAPLLGYSNGADLPLNVRDSVRDSAVDAQAAHPQTAAQLWRLSPTSHTSAMPAGRRLDWIEVNPPSIGFIIIVSAFGCVVLLPLLICCCCCYRALRAADAKKLAFNGADWRIDGLPTTALPVRCARPTPPCHHGSPYRPMPSVSIRSHPIQSDQIQFVLSTPSHPVSSYPVLSQSII